MRLWMTPKYEKKEKKKADKYKNPCTVTLFMKSILEHISNRKFVKYIEKGNSFRRFERSFHDPVKILSYPKIIFILKVLSFFRLEIKSSFTLATQRYQIITFVSIYFWASVNSNEI